MSSIFKSSEAQRNDIEERIKFSRKNGVRIYNSWPKKSESIGK